MCSCVSFASKEIKMSNFVTRVGNVLYKNGKVFRFSGSNCYWLGLYQQPNSTVRYPTNQEIDDALLTAKSLGHTVIRSHTLGISVGNALSVWTALNTVNNTAFATMDYAIKRCADFGMLLIIPLTDLLDAPNHYYMGNKANFCTFRALGDEHTFYTNGQVFTDFTTGYCNTIITHVNSLTGIAYKDDPTILGWESGNEGHASGGAVDTLQAIATWTQNLGTYIKSIDSNHLYIDGYQGINPYALNNSTTDILSNHYYPVNISQLLTDAYQAEIAGKVFLCGEYDWLSVSQGEGQDRFDDIDSFLPCIEASRYVSGALLWSIMSVSMSGGDQYGLFLDSRSPTNRILALQNHSAIMNGTSSTTNQYPIAGGVYPDYQPIVAPEMGIPTIDKNGRVYSRQIVIAENYKDYVARQGQVFALIFQGNGPLSTGTQYSVASIFNPVNSGRQLFIEELWYFDNSGAGGSDYLLQLTADPNYTTPPVNGTLNGPNDLKQMSGLPETCIANVTFNPLATALPSGKNTMSFTHQQGVDVVVPLVQTMILEPGQGIALALYMPIGTVGTPVAHYSAINAIIRQL